MVNGPGAFADEPAVANGAATADGPAIADEPAIANGAAVANEAMVTGEPAVVNEPAAANEPAVAGRNASGKVVVEKATVERVDGVPRIIVNGQPIQARMFFSHWGHTGPTEALRSQLRLAKQAGVQIVSFMSTHTNWYEPDGTYDWSRLDTLCDAILEENPDALLIPRLAVYAPGWWLKQHPNAKMEWIGRDPKQGSDVDWLRESVASPEYRQEACKVLATVIQHLEDKYGDHMLGYHPAGQNTDEWFMPNTWLRGYASYAADDLTAWRGWLKQKYGTDQALQQAWDDAAVTLETAEIPGLELRGEAAKHPALNAPELGRRFVPIIDHNHYLQEQMTDTIRLLAKTVKETTHGRKLCLFFYGYVFEFGSVSKGPAASAHYNLRALLECPDIDILSSPMSYFDRQPGGAGSCMTAAESILQAGKLYVFEDDTRTYLGMGSTFPGGKDGADTPEQTRNLLLRNVGECIVRNIGSWWMDLGASGWFNDPTFWTVYDELKPVAEYFTKHPTLYQPEVGLFLDEASVWNISGGDGARLMIAGTRGALNRLGAPYSQYLMDDLEAGRVQPPKLCVLLNPQGLGAERKAKIDALVREHGSTPLWLDFTQPDYNGFRDFAKSVGMFLYTDEPCNVWANGPFAVLHAAADGEVHINIPPQYHEIVNIPAVVTLKKGETRVVEFQ